MLNETIIKELAITRATGLAKNLISGSNAGSIPAALLQLTDSGTNGESWNIETGRAADGALNIYQGGIGNRISILADGTTRLHTCVNAGADTDKFLVLDANGDIDYRTGDNVLADIGAAPADLSAYLKRDGSVALTADWDAGAFDIRALTFESDVATGTSPFTIASTTVCTNLNADLLDGQHSTYFAPAAAISGTATYIPKFAVGGASIVDSDMLVGTGTADYGRTFASLLFKSTVDGVIGINTVDGSDDRYLSFTAGSAGSAARGATFALYGNEFSSLPSAAGALIAYSGNTPNAYVEFNAVGASGTVLFKTANTLRMQINNTYTLSNVPILFNAADGLKIGIDTTSYNKYLVIGAGKTESYAEGPLIYLIGGSYGSGVGGVMYLHAGSTAGAWVDYDARSATGSHRFKINGTEIARVNSTGFGVGCTPSVLAEIRGGLTTTGAVLTLGTKETTVDAGDVLGRINFYAPLESSGTDAILPGASIAAIAEASFTNAVNATSLVFSTGASETATEKMRLTSAGYLGIGTIPERPLDVNGTTDQLQLTYNSADGSATYYTRFATNSAGNLIITPSGGYTGFGATTPLANVHVGTGSDAFTQAISPAAHTYITGPGHSMLTIRDATNDIECGFFTYSNTGKVYLGSWTNHTLVIRTNNVDAITIDTQGNSTCAGYLKQAGIFGGIHVHDASTGQTIPTGTTYTKLTCYTDNNEAANVTPDAANDKITITIAGRYQVSGSFNFYDDTNNVVWRIAPFLNGTEQDHIHVKRKIGTATDSGSASFTGVIDVTSVPVDLDVRARHDYGGDVSLVMEYSNFNILYVGET